MSLRTVTGFTAAAFLGCAMAGCLSLGDKNSLKYLGDANLEHYKDYATRIEFPCLDEECENDSIVTRPPRRIRHPKEEELWDLHLARVIQMAMANNKIMRTRNQFLVPQSALMVGPNQSNNSVFDPALQETAVFFGNRGLNAALADFDANVATGITWGRNETVQNNRFLSGGLAPGDTLTDETARFTSGLEKQMADGGIFSVSHNWNYSLNNVPSRLFGSSYSGTLQFDYRRPLWAGAGTEFTRIVGPIGRNLQGIPTVFQGVVVARINNDISLTSFEMNVRDMLKDVEDLYWDLALTYQTYHSETVAKDSALGTWRKVEAKRKVGGKGGGAALESLARDNYFEARGRAESALADLYSTEAQLRRMLNLPVNDGKIIRPADEPATAEIVPDWRNALTEALTRRVELRRQKWEIKKLQLGLKAAKSLTKPRLDFTAQYRNNGFGDRLLAKNDTDGFTPHGLRSFYGNLTQGDQTGWELGFQMSFPLGARLARTQVRNYEFQLAKARAALAAQEHEISHELADAFQNIDRWYQAARTNFSRRQAAATRVRAYTERNKTEDVLDFVLRAQISLSQAEIAFRRSVVEYNKAITNLHFRKGTLLEMNRVTLAEGLWSPEAYDDALRRAWSRSHGIEDQSLRTEPEEFVTGAPSSVYLGEPDNSHAQPFPDSKLPPQPADPKPKGDQSPPAKTQKPVAAQPSDFGHGPVDLTSYAASIKISDGPAQKVERVKNTRSLGRRTIRRFPKRPKTGESRSSTKRTQPPGGMNTPARGGETIKGQPFGSAAVDLGPYAAEFRFLDQAQPGVNNTNLQAPVIRPGIKRFPLRPPRTP